MAGSGLARDAFAQGPSGFAVDRNPSRDGVFQLSWKAAGPVVVESSMDDHFERTEVVYHGHDLATTISGQSDGVIFYRLVDAGTNAVVGEPVRVEIRHHPLSRALAFFTLGFVVFTATVALIIRGARSTNPANAGGTDREVHHA